MTQDYIRAILSAKIYDLVDETPLEDAPLLASRIGNRVLLKREDLQPVFSFKIRGAYNKLMSLTQQERDAGVIAASAGNHAQGVALGANHLGIRSIIVMPKTTPQIKVDSVRRFGGTPVLFGDSYDQAYEHARELAAREGYTFIHPYDDPVVIAGQGTVGVEILRQFPGHIDAIFIAVGGGGLCAGIATYLKYLRPEIRIIAVEPDDAACLDIALKTGRRETLSSVGLFADGVAVAQIGEETFKILQPLVDEVVLVNADEICAGIKDVFEDTRSIVEPAGALSVAAMKKYALENNISGQTFVGINCGANMNFDRLRYISERTEIGEKREAVLAVTIPERPGSFKAFCKLLDGRSITEFNYRYASTNQAHIYVGVQVSSSDDRQALVENLTKAEYPVLDMTENEVAKLHLRYMVGGHSDGAGGELVYRFEFPERPRALLRFLDKLGDRWNISMFHYRNHGSAYGRILVGMQIPKSDKQAAEAFFQELNYQYWDETENPAYQLFLGS